MGQNKQILVICYSETGRAYLGVILDRINYAPVLVKTAGDAIRHARNTSPSLVIIDGDLPEDELRSAVALVKTEAAMKDLPLIVITSNDDGQEKASLVAQGCTDVLTKPLDLFLFQSLLMELTGGMRISPRVAIQMPVVIEEGTPEKILSCINISEGGIFLRTRKPLPTNTSVRLKFTLPHGSLRIGVTSEVIHASPFGEHTEREPGMGLRFLDIPEGARKEIRSLIQYDHSGERSEKQQR